MWRLHEIDQGIDFIVTRSDNGGDFAEVDVDIVETGEKDWSCLDRGVRPGTDYVYRVEYENNGTSHFLFETEILKTPVADVTLSQNLPNPFNPSTRIGYYVPRESDVTLTIYDVNGTSIRTLVSSNRLEGSYTAEWDGRDDLGVAAASGVYLCRLEIGKAQRTIKMLLLK